jgi:hypothetical protein
MTTYLCSVSGDFPENYQIGLAARTWGVEEKYSGRIASVTPGDTLVFAVGGEFRSIHRVESAAFFDPTPLWPQKDGSYFPHRIKISDPIAVGQLPIKNVSGNISFMSAVGRHWGGTIQGRNGVFNDRLTSEDLNFIRARMRGEIPQAIHVEPEKIKQVQERQKTLFKLYESDVETRIIQSLSKLNLRLYANVVTGRSGRQFLIDGGSGRIDLLCEDLSTGEFVVVELKKGEAPQDTMLQMLRYMSWVRQHLAGTKDVRGIILTESADSTLSEIVKEVPKVAISLLQNRRSSALSVRFDRQHRRYRVLDRRFVMQAKRWKCGVCGSVYTFALETEAPSPCRKCGGTFLDVALDYV